MENKKTTEKQKINIEKKGRFKIIKKKVEVDERGMMISNPFFVRKPPKREKPLEKSQSPLA